MIKDTIVVLSIPFQRLLRSHLSNFLLDIFSKNADILIVSPFSENSSFVEKYTKDGIFHLSVPNQDRLPWILNKLTLISSFLRVRGYWRRNRQHLAYYWMNRYTRYGGDANDKTESFAKRWLMDSLAVIGAWPKAWKLLDKLIGPFSYDVASIKVLTNKYRHVVLVQAASWGFEDQALAWMAQKNKWRTILIPYTTDQLFCNGYLYCDYDAICVQGETEKRFALDLHGLTERNLKELGSVYFRAIDQILLTNIYKREIAKGSIKRIMYAGVAAAYFPLESEFLGLEAILDAKASGVLKNIEVIYRPVCESVESRRLVEQRFSGISGLKIQYPSSSEIGLNLFNETNTNENLERLIIGLTQIDLMVMSTFTSLALDAAYVGVPSVSFYGDTTGILNRRKTDLIFDTQSRKIGFESIPVAKTTKELTELICNILDNPVLQKKLASDLVFQWDYRNENFAKELNEILFNS